MKRLELQDALNYVASAKAGNGIVMRQNAQGVAERARSKVFYIAGIGSEIAVNNNELITPGTKKILGTSNFDVGNSLNAGRNILVLGVRILFDVTANVTPLTAAWQSTAPVAFKNGELVITQDGSPGNLLEMPMSVLSKYSGSINTEDDFRAIVPFIIRETSPFKFHVNLAGAADAGLAWRLEFDCVEFTNAAQA